MRLEIRSMTSTFLSSCFYVLVICCSNRRTRCQDLFSVSTSLATAITRWSITCSRAVKISTSLQLNSTSLVYSNNCNHAHFLIIDLPLRLGGNAIHRDLSFLASDSSTWNLIISATCEFSEQDRSSAQLTMARLDEFDAFPKFTA